MMRCKLDENLSIRLAQPLIDRGCDVSSIHEQNMKGEKDDVAYVDCGRESRVLITRDIGFADIRTYPPADGPGIVVLRPKQPSVSQIKALIVRLADHLVTLTPQRHLTVVTPTSVRVQSGIDSPHETES